MVLLFLSQSAQDFIEDKYNARHMPTFAFLSQSAQDFIEDWPRPARTPNSTSIPEPISSGLH